MLNRFQQRCFDLDTARRPTSCTKSPQALRSASRTHPPQMTAASCQLLQRSIALAPGSLVQSQVGPGVLSNEEVRNLTSRTDSSVDQQFRVVKHATFQGVHPDGSVIAKKPGP